MAQVATQITRSQLKKNRSKVTQPRSQLDKPRSLLKMPTPQKKMPQLARPKSQLKKPMPLLKTPWPQLNHPGLNWHIQVTTQHQHAQATTHSTCPTQQSQVTAKLCFRDFPRMRASDTSSATRRFARSVLPPEPSLSLSPSLLMLWTGLVPRSFLLSPSFSLSLSSLSRSRSR